MYDHITLTIAKAFTFGTFGTSGLYSKVKDLNTSVGAFTELIMVTLQG